MKTIITYILTLITITGFSQNVKELSIAKENGKYFLTNVKVNGQLVHARFILDTGAETLISEEWVKKLGIKINSGTTEFTDDKEIKALANAKADFDIDNINFGTIKINVIKDKVLSPICNVAGIIGNDLMAQKSWYLSKDKIMIIDKVKKYSEIEEFKKEKLILNSKTYPTFVVKVGTPRTYSLFDLGDNSFGSISSGLYKYVKNSDFIKGYGVSSLNAFSENSNGGVAKINTIELNGLSINDAVIYVDNNDEKLSFSLGSEFLNYFDIILDFPKKKVYFKQKLNTYDTTFWHKFNFKVNVTDENVTVNYLWGKSNEFQLGDKIFQINGKSIMSLGSNECEIRNEFNYLMRENNSLELKILRDTKESIIKVSKKNILKL